MARDESRSGPHAGTYEGRFAAEHRRLDAMFEALLAALRGGSSDTALRERFAEMRESLEAHIDQEDRLYYPAVRALRPVHRDVIEELVRAHELFRARLEEIDGDLARGAIAEAGRELDTFVGAFGEHEATEERLLRAIDAELSEAVGAKPG